MKVRTKLKACLIISIFLLGIACTAAAGQTIYVDSDAAGANDGSSWTDAYNYLQDALADANSSLKSVEIRVAQGTYRPDEDTLHPDGTGDREATFQLVNGVNLKGGYAGFGKPDPNARDMEKYETILSGDLDGNDVDVNDLYDLLDEPTRVENSFHVVTGSNTDSNAVLDGFTVTAGNANGSYPDGSGGGMYNYEGSPTIANCMFSGNAAVEGGGMNNYYGSPTVIGCTFSENTASASGGGIRTWGSPMLTNCTFIGNSARWGGGGMINWGGRPILTNCRFSGNLTNLEGGGMYNCYSNPTLTNCTFCTNTAHGDGGGIFSSVESELTLTNCVLWGDTATRGNEIALHSYEEYSIVTVSYTNIEGAAAEVYVGPGSELNWSEGNMDVNPLFVDPNKADYHLKSEGWRWDANRKVWTWDDITSPCIDAGNPGCPLGEELLSVPSDPNNELGQNLRINMGAYGGTSEASMALPGWALLADLTNDRIVDFNDLAVFVHYWLDKGRCLPSDLDRDGSVDLADFVLIADDWLRDNNP